jgi:hypothetical protein
MISLKSVFHKTIFFWNLQVEVSSLADGDGFGVNVKPLICLSRDWLGYKRGKEQGVFTMNR